jgi:hypothetical protein
MTSLPSKLNAPKLERQLLVLHSWPCNETLLWHQNCLKCYTQWHPAKTRPLKGNFEPAHVAALSRGQLGEKTLLFSDKCQQRSWLHQIPTQYVVMFSTIGPYPHHLEYIKNKPNHLWPNLISNTLVNSANCCMHPHRCYIPTDTKIITQTHSNWAEQIQLPLSKSK